jgi:hypothetical protein
MLVGLQYVLGRDWLVMMNVLDEGILRKRMMNMAYTMGSSMN